MESLLQLFKNLNTKQKKVFVIATGAFIFVVSLFITGALLTSDNYVSHKRELAIVNQSDFQKVYNAFQKSDIEIETSNKNGKVLIEVSDDDFKKAHLKISTLDISSSKLLGWKLFEESKLGKSSFDNNVNYIRALEEELQMSINIIDGVINSKVKISLPKETLFIDRLSEPKASVIIELKPGRALNRKQITGIKNFIANSIEKLTVNNVELINSNGISLEVTEDGGLYSMAQEQMKYKNDVEQKLKDKILMNLSPVVGGLANITAEISIDFDFNKKNSYEEIYDPNSVIRSAKNKNLKLNTKKAEKINGGIPGVVSNIAKDPSNNSKNNDIIQDKKEVEDISNFEISKKVINTQKKRYGDILKIGAAITFNTDAFKGKDLELVKSKITNIVKSAINFEVDRGDQINVEGFAFFTFEKEKSTKEEIQEGLGIFGQFFSEYGFIFQYLALTALLIFFYKRFVIGSTNIQLMEEDDNYESSEEMKLRKVKRDSERKRLLEDQYDDELQRKEEEKKKMEKRIKDQLESITELTEEQELKYAALLQSLREQTKGKEEDVANLFENLLEIN